MAADKIPEIIYNCGMPVTIYKKNLLFTSFFILLAHVCFAQAIVEVPKFGKIDIGSLQMKDCSFEPGAPAINLIKYEEVQLLIDESYNSKIVTVIRYRIKILNQRGFKYATIIIPYNGSKISDLQGATYNLEENGQVKISPVSKSDIFRSKSKTDDESSMRFTFPNVKAGSVLEYQFTQKEKDTYFIPSWYFQDNIPNMLSVCIIGTPVFSRIQKRVLSDLPVEEGSQLDESKGFDNRVQYLSFAMRDIPSFRSEPLMSSSRDYKYRIDFLVNPHETLSDLTVKNSNNKWSAINLHLLRAPYFGRQFEVPIAGTKSFLDSTTVLKTTAEKVNAVYNYVKRNIKWNKYYYIFSENLNDVWKKKEGTSAEINLSILNLLRWSGVQSYPVLFSTRLHGKTDFNFPSLSQFNTVDVVAVDGNRFYLLDGTNPYLSFQTIPYNVVNRTGMIIDYDNNNMINVDFGRKLIWDSVSITGTIDSNGILKGNATTKYFDLAKVQKLQDETEEDDEETDSESESSSEIKIDSSYELNKEDALMPLIECTKFHYELPVSNDFYFLNPFLFSELSKNPFIDSSRKTDIDFGAVTSFTVHMEIVLPKEIKLEELMKNKQTSTTDSSIAFRFTNEISNDTIYINSNFEINKPVFYKQDYNSVKNFFQDVYGLLNNQILLRKKEVK